MRPSSLGGSRILRRTLSVCPSVCLSVCLSVRPSFCLSVCLSVCPSVPLADVVLLFYSRTVLRANIQNRKKTSVFAYGPARRMYFSAGAEGRISYGHLGRTSLSLHRYDQIIWHSELYTLAVKWSRTCEIASNDRSSFS